MAEQTTLWQEQQHTALFAELCNALYERELSRLARGDLGSLSALQGRIRSLPHYIKRLAWLMISVDSPLAIDSQNAVWSAKQSLTAPLAQQEMHAHWAWYFARPIPYGLVVPIALHDRITLDCIDGIDDANKRLRTNAFGWFAQSEKITSSAEKAQLLKPTRKVMIAACAGHRWTNNRRQRPYIPSLRELLLSCNINWQNFNKVRGASQCLLNG